MIDMMEVIEMIKNGDMEFSLGQAATFTRATIKQTCGMALDRCIGLMAHTIKGNGKMAFKMVKVKI